MNGAVLIVEDEALVALTIEEILLEAGFTVCGIADRPTQALTLAQRHKPDIAIIDVRLAAGGDGIGLADDLAPLGPMLILFATGNPSEVRQRARVGHGCLAKPFESEWLIAVIEAIRTGGRPDIPSFFPLPVR